MSSVHACVLSGLAAKEIDVLMDLNVCPVSVDVLKYLLTERWVLFIVKNKTGCLLWKYKNIVYELNQNRP